MKVVAVSHSCVVDVNQKAFVALRKIPSVEVELIVPRTWRSEYTGALHLAETHADVDFPIHALPVRFAGSVSLHWYKSGLAETIRTAAPDVVFLDQEPWSLVASQVIRICKKLDVPCISYTKQNINKKYPPPFNWIERRTYAGSSAILALTEAARDVLRGKGFGGPCPILPHGYDPSIFSPGCAQSRRQDLALRGVVIGYMGRFVSIKGLQTLIDACRRLRAEHADVEFTVLMVGSGPLEAELAAQVAKDGLDRHFIFTGPVTHRDAPQYLRCMDLFVLPSVTLTRAREQFGRVIIEAMACGVPVLGSTSGNIPVLIRETGGGEVFPEGDAVALAALLKKLIANPNERRRLGQIAATAVQERYTYDSIAAELHRVLSAHCSNGVSHRLPSSLITDAV